MPSLRLCPLILLIASGAFAHDDDYLQYLANEGVAVIHGETTLLFDPLFRQDYGNYTLVPEATRAAMLDAQPPFETVNAVFVSHHHGDHFDPADMLRLMAKHKLAHLYAPQQAVQAMKSIADSGDAAIFARVHGLDLAYDDEPQTIRNGDVVVGAFLIPHSGWPTARTDVQNIAFRVTINKLVSIVHLGDADPNRVHFERHENEWRRQKADVALPPYWFFNSRDGNQILRDYVRADQAVGVHVPAAYSDGENIPADLRGFDLFTRPGETRPLPEETR